VCHSNCHNNYKKYPEEFSKFVNYVRALHCPTRWAIIRLIDDKLISTHEIFEGLKNEGENLSKSGLYYHLSELEKAGIIELAEYREVGGGAPEKVWKLRAKEITINLTDLTEGVHEDG
jgi:DNA-binding transcriptional ArsR family regulator